MKTICHLTSAHSRYDVRIFLKECCSIANAGYNVFLVVADGKGDEFKDKVNIIDTGILKGRFNRMFNTTKKVYKKALEINADLYHFHDYELIGAGLKLKKKGKIVIYDVHENFPKAILDREWMPKICRKPVSILVRMYENFTAKKFNYLLTARRDIKARFKKVTRNAITINNYPILNDLIADERMKNINKTEISYVGVISKIRGIIEMVKSIRDLPVKLNLAGKFESKELRNEAVKTEGWENVNELGVIERKKIKEILSSSFAGLVIFYPAANHISTQPNKLYEYISASVPVICSNFPLWESLISIYKCGICVNPKNHEEIKKAIQYLYENPQKAKEMGKNGRRAVEKFFNWKREEKKLLMVYKKILEGNR
ncbi:MAG: glycosyltransferase [Spirochaetia bacterium]|nr:glycosyltransferase [Spirochaetia bacterium]